MFYFDSWNIFVYRVKAWRAGASSVRRAGLLSLIHIFDAGSLKVVNTLLLAGELSVAQDGNLVVGHDEWQGLYDYVLMFQRVKAPSQSCSLAAL